MKCPGSTPVCQRKTWDFENGTTQGFFQRTDISDIAHSSVINSTTRAHGGTHSLAVPLKSSGGTFDVSMPTCGGGGGATPLPTAGRSVTFCIYVDGALAAAGPNYLTANVWGCIDGGCITAASVTVNPLPVGTWFSITAPVSAAAAAAHPVADGFDLQGAVNPSAATTVYIDDVVFQ